MNIKDIKTCTSKSDLDYIINKEHKLNSVLQTALLYIKNNHSNMDSTVLAVVYDKICTATDDKLPEDSKINDKTTETETKTDDFGKEHDLLSVNKFHIENSSDFRKLYFRVLNLQLCHVKNVVGYWKDCLSDFDIKSNYKKVKQFQSEIAHTKNVHYAIYALVLLASIPVAYFQSGLLGFGICMLALSFMVATSVKTIHLMCHNIYYSDKPATTSELISAIKLVKKQNYNIIHTCYSRKQDLNHIKLKRMRDNQTPLDHIKAIDNGNNSWDKIAKQVSNAKIHDEELEHKDECMAKS